MDDGGKGSKPRPFDVAYQDYVERWDAIFGKKEDKPCTHAVWGHKEGSYFCIECGITNEAGPYVSR